MTSANQNSPRDVNRRTSQIIEEALALSEDWHSAYLERHAYDTKRFTREMITKLAIARYEWLLSTARHSILHSFSDDELYIVATSLEREVAIPNDYPMAHAIADDNSILWENYKESSLCSLIEKIAGLTPLEDMALRDMVEQFWRRPREGDDWFSEYMKKERSFLERTDDGAAR